MSGQITNKPLVNPHVSVDCVIFGFDGKDLQVLIIARDEKFKDLAPSLPGDLIREDEDLDEAANRVLFELTGIKDIFLEQFRAFGAPDRISNPADAEWVRAVRSEPDARVITIGYFALVRTDYVHPSPSSFAKKAVWVPIKEVGTLAFDHNRILQEGRKALRKKLQSRPLGMVLLPKKFTLRALQELYEAILGKTLDKRNFRRKILKSGILEPLEIKEKGVPYKPARYYQFNKVAYENFPENEFYFVN